MRGDPSEHDWQLVKKLIDDMPKEENPYRYSHLPNRRLEDMLRAMEKERDDMKRAIGFAYDLTDFTSMSYFLHAYYRGDEEYIRKRWPEFYEEN